MSRPLPATPAPLAESALRPRRTPAMVCFGAETINHGRPAKESRAFAMEAMMIIPGGTRSSRPAPLHRRYLPTRPPARTCRRVSGRRVTFSNDLPGLDARSGDLTNWIAALVALGSEGSRTSVRWIVPGHGPIGDLGTLDRVPAPEPLARARLRDRRPRRLDGWIRGRRQVARRRSRSRCHVPAASMVRTCRRMGSEPAHPPVTTSILLRRISRSTASSRASAPRPTSPARESLRHSRPVQTQLKRRAARGS